MGKFFNEIPDFLVSWMEEQELFWVGSCPLSPDGHVNISPKGVRGSFHIVNANKVWYQDLTGSGKLMCSGSRSWPLMRRPRHRNHFTLAGKW
jgi:hypothetical protein